MSGNHGKNTPRNRRSSWTPEPFEPGAEITWTHYYPDGHTIERTGTILDRAPAVRATRDRAALVMAWWVQPHEPLPGDLHAFIAVGKAGGRSTAIHGRYLDGAGVRQYATKGDLFASNYAGSQTGGLVVQAIQEMREHATANGLAA